MYFSLTAFIYVLFVTSLKVPFWESIMVAVIRIAGTLRGMIATLILRPVLVKISSMFGVEIVLLPQYYLMEPKCLYHSQTMTMD